MDLDRPEILATSGALPSGGARIWLASVSAGMRTVEAVIRELSQNDVPVLVVAEHGSGKAAAAARIHALSSRAAQAFEVYQGSEASDQILASFLGDGGVGNLGVGNGGTVYLQEVGDLTAAAQKTL